MDSCEPLSLETGIGKSVRDFHSYDMSVRLHGAKLLLDLIKKLSTPNGGKYNNNLVHQQIKETPAINYNAVKRIIAGLQNYNPPVKDYNAL